MEKYRPGCTVWYRDGIGFFLYYNGYNPESVFLLHVVEDVLDIFVILDTGEELLDGLALLGRDILVVVGYTLEFGRDNLHTLLLKEFLDIGELLESSVDHPLLLFGLDFGVEVHEVEFKFLHVGIAGLEVEHTLMVEQE